jgi:hypothetical protein
LLVQHPSSALYRNLKLRKSPGIQTPRLLGVKLGANLFCKPLASFERGCGPILLYRTESLIFRPFVVLGVARKGPELPRPFCCCSRHWSPPAISSLVPSELQRWGERLLPLRDSHADSDEAARV